MAQIIIDYFQTALLSLCYTMKINCHAAPRFVPPAGRITNWSQMLWFGGMTQPATDYKKYADIIAGVEFVPFAIETSGVWGEQALDLVKEACRRIAALTHEPRSTAFLRQRISVAVQRGNAYWHADACRVGQLTFQYSASDVIGQSMQTRLL